MISFKNEMESYLTVKKSSGPIEFKEKGSRFISFVYPIENADEAGRKIKKLRKEYHSATHVCFAFLLGKGSEDYFRYNDDGEPSGTAGLPIYNEIKRSELSNVLVAVVRYFGGTKLGTGGLARAYGRSARLVLDGSEKITVCITNEINLQYPYDLTGEIMSAVNESGAKIISREYIEDKTRMKLIVPSGKIEILKNLLQDRGKGRITIQ